MSNPFDAPQAGEEYQDVRPGYPLAAVDALASAVHRPVRDVADIGAGTGKFSRAVARAMPGVNVLPIEPSAQMRASFVGPMLPLDGTSENTGLCDRSVDLVVWAQSFHWVDPQASGLEARRVLRAGGAAAVLFNQLDVGVPWVHRLSRIMRSGDVHRRDRAPALPGFVSESVLEFTWHQNLSTDQVMALARTRASYLRSGEASRQKMQDNLDWYLHQHLGYSPGATVVLPYMTLLWVMR